MSYSQASYARNLVQHPECTACYLLSLLLLQTALFVFLFGICVAKRCIVMLQIICIFHQKDIYSSSYAEFFSAHTRQVYMKLIYRVGREQKSMLWFEQKPRSPPDDGFYVIRWTFLGEWTGSSGSRLHRQRGHVVHLQIILWVIQVWFKICSFFIHKWNACIHSEQLWVAKLLWLMAWNCVSLTIWEYKTYKMYRTISHNKGQISRLRGHDLKNSRNPAKNGESGVLAGVSKKSGRQDE